MLHQSAMLPTEFPTKVAESGIVSEREYVHTLEQVNQKLHETLSHAHWMKGGIPAVFCSRVNGYLEDAGQPRWKLKYVQQQIYGDEACLMQVTVSRTQSDGTKVKVEGPQPSTSEFFSLFYVDIPLQ